MTIVTIKTDQRIIDIWEREAKKACPDANIKVLDKTPSDIIDLVNTLIQCDDDVLYTLPVHIIHSTDFTNMLHAKDLEQRDFVCFKQQGSPSIMINFFAATQFGLKKISEMAKGRFTPDTTINMDINISNLILNALGDKVEIINDNNTLVKSLSANCKEIGQIVTYCGSGEIMNIISEAKLNTFDVVSHIMNTLTQPNKNVEYRNK